MKVQFISAIAMAAFASSMAFSPARAADDPAGAPPAAQSQSSQQSQQHPARPQMSADDRAAFFDARVAAVHAGLKLTPQQEAMWPPVEQAWRDGAAKMGALRAPGGGAQQPTDAMDRLRRMADAATARGETLRKIIDAAQPLYASLSDDQKRRVGLLLRGPGMGKMGAMRMAPGQGPAMRNNEGRNNERADAQPDFRPRDRGPSDDDRFNNRFNERGYGGRGPRGDGARGRDDRADPRSRDRDERGPYADRDRRGNRDNDNNRDRYDGGDRRGRGDRRDDGAGQRDPRDDDERL